MSYKRDDNGGKAQSSSSSSSSGGGSSSGSSRLSANVTLSRAGTTSSNSNAGKAGKSVSTAASNARAAIQASRAGALANKQKQTGQTQATRYQARTVSGGGTPVRTPAQSPLGRVPTFNEFTASKNSPRLPWESGGTATNFESPVGRFSTPEEEENGKFIAEANDYNAAVDYLMSGNTDLNTTKSFLEQANEKVANPSVPTMARDSLTFDWQNLRGVLQDQLHADNRKEYDRLADEANKAQETYNTLYNDWDKAHRSGAFAGDLPTFEQSEEEKKIDEAKALADAAAAARDAWVPNTNARREELIQKMHANAGFLRGGLTREEQQELLTLDAQLLNPEINYGKDFTIRGDVPKGVMMQGVEGINRAASQTANFLVNGLPSVFNKPAQFLVTHSELARDIDALASEMFNPIQSGAANLDQYVADIQASDAIRYAQNFSGDKMGEAINKYGPQVVEAIPMMLVAVATGGTSAGLMAGENITELSALAQSSGITGLAKSAESTLKAYATDPNFQLVFAQELGNSYDTAKEDGANDLQATAYALMNAFANAGIEIGSGIQNLPGEMADAIKTGKKDVMLAYAKSIGEEMGEEIRQGAAASALKGEYKDVPLYSTEDEDAVINPNRMKEEAKGAAIVSGILGAPSTIRGAVQINPNGSLSSPGVRAVLKGKNRHDTATGVLAEGFETQGYVNSTNEDEDFTKSTTGMENRPLADEEADAQSYSQSLEEEAKRQAEAAAEEERRKAEEEKEAENKRLEEEARRREQEIEGARRAAQAYQEEQDRLLDAAQEAEKFAQLAHNAREFEAEQQYIREAQQARQQAEEAQRKKEEALNMAKSQSQALNAQGQPVKAAPVKTAPIDQEAANAMAQSQSATLEGQEKGVSPAPVQTASATDEQEVQAMSASQAQTIAGQDVSPAQAPKKADASTATETAQGDVQAATLTQTPESAEALVKPKENAQSEGSAPVATAEQGRASIESGETNNKTVAEVVPMVDKYVSEQAPISSVPNNPFAKTGTKAEPPLSKKVMQWFKSRFPTGVRSKALGGEPVVINERGIKNDVAHGVGEAKAATFAAVPDVIRDGTIVSRSDGGENGVSVTIAGNVNLAGTPVNVYCVLKQADDRSKRFYLHEVTDGNGNLYYQLEQNKNATPALQDSTGTNPASADVTSATSIAQPVQSGNTTSTSSAESDTITAQLEERRTEDGTVSARGRESEAADSGSDGRTRDVISRAPVFSGEHAEQHRAKWTETAEAIEASGGRVYAKDELPPLLRKASEVYERIFGHPITYYDASNMPENTQVGSAVKNVPGAGAFVAYNHPALRRVDGGIANGPGTAGFHEGTHNRWDERGEGISRKRTVLDAMYRAHITKADAKGMANYVLQKYGFKYTKQRGMEGYLGVNSNQEWANLSDEARASRLASIPTTVRNDIIEDLYEEIGNYLATNDVRYKQYQSFGNVADEMRNGLVQAGIYTQEEIDEALREAAEQDEAAMAEKEQRDKEQAEYDKLVQEAKPIDEFEPSKGTTLYELPFTVEDDTPKKNLVAIHNCSVSSARHILSDGGKAMPSIAVSKSSREHSDFGEVSFILSPDSIDPSVDSHNKIYGGDAYTPIYDKNVAGEISGDIDGFAEEVAQLAKKFLPDSDPKDAEFRPGAYTGTGGDTLEDFMEGAYRTQIPIKAAIAAERGHDLSELNTWEEDPTVQTRFDIEPSFYTEDSDEAYMFGIDPFLESLVSDLDVKDWLTQKFKKYGIKENFLEQQLKAMRMQPARNRPFLYDFESLDELRSHKNLLSATREHVVGSEEAYKEARQLREYAVGAIYYDTELDEDEARAALETIAEYQRDFTKDEDYDYFFRNAYGQDGISPETIEAIQNALFASAEQPTGYFEAKPDRILPLDEFKAVLLPADQQQLAAEFEKAGVKAFLYKTPYLENTSYIEDRLQHYKRILKDVRNVGTDVAHIKGWLQPHEDMDWLVGRIEKLEQDLEIASKAKTRMEIINEDLTQYLFEEPYLENDATSKATDAASGISLPPVDSTSHTPGKESVTQSAAEKQMATKGERANTDAAMGEATYISRTNAARSETADHLTDTQEKADAQTQRLLKDDYVWNDDDVVIAQKLMFDMIKSIRDYQMHRGSKMKEAAFRKLTEQYNRLMDKHQKMLSEAGQKLQANYMFSYGDKIIMKAAQTFLGFTKDGRFAGAAPNAKNAKIYAGIEEAVKRISAAIEAKDTQGLAKICKDISNIRNVKKMFGPLGKFADEMESRVLERVAKGENAAANLEKLAYGNLNAVCDDVQPYKPLNAAKTIRVMNMLSNTATIVNNLANNFAQGAVSRSMVNQAFNQLAAKPFEALTGQKIISSAQRGKAAQKAVHNAKVEALETATLMQMYGISENNGRLELNDRGMFNPNINAFEQTMSLYKFLTGMGVEATDQMQAAGFLKAMELGIDEDIKAGRIDAHTREQRMQEARHEVNRLLYKDDNTTTALVQHVRDYLNKFSIGNEKTGTIGLGDITMAFAKIPANVVRARLAMTPEGALLQLFQYAKGVNKAKRMHSEVLANGIVQKHSAELEKYRTMLNALYETESSQERTKAIEAVKNKLSAINNQMWAEAREQCRGSVFKNLETIRNNYNENMPYDEAVERAGYTNAKEMSQFEAAQLSRKIGRAATSVGMMALGSVLRALGGLRDFDQEPDDEIRKRNKDNGYQGLMFNANAMFRPGHEWEDGDLTLDGEFLEVIAMPLTIGATAAEAAATAQDAKTLAWLKSMAGNGIAKTFEAVGDIPGMADAINMYESMTSAYTMDYDEKTSRLKAGLLNYAANTVPSFFLPNSVSQAAAGFDNTVRDVYTADNAWGQAKNIFMNKFPVMRNKIPASVDVWGNERNYGDGLWGAVNKMLLPGDVRVYRKNKYEAEIERLVKEGYGNATPKTTVNSSFEVGDEKYTMTAQEKRDFKLGRNQRQKELYESFIDSDYYNQLTDAERLKVFKALKTSAERDAKQTMLNDRQLNVQVTRDRWETELTDINDQIQFLAAKQMANDALDRDEEDMDYKAMDDYLTETYKKLNETQRGLLDSTFSRLDDMYEAKSKYGIGSEMWQKGYDIYKDYASDEGKASVQGGYKDWEGSQMYTDIAKATGASEKQMDFFEDKFVLYNNNAVTPDTYNAFVDAGWSRDSAQAMVKSVADLTPTNGRKTVSYTQRLTAIATTPNLTEAQRWEAFFEYCPVSYTKVISRMNWYKSNGMPYEKALKAINKWDE